MRQNREMQTEGAHMWGMCQWLSTT